MHQGDNITALRGIGPKKAAAYEKLGIKTIHSLLMHAPRSYLDLRKCEELDGILPNDGRPHLICARIVSKGREQYIRKGLTVFHVTAVADGVDLRLTFYNTRYTVAALPTDGDVFLYGYIGGTLLRREMTSPTVISSCDAGKIVPVYPTAAGLSSKAVAQDIKQALSALDAPISGVIPDDEAAALGLMALSEAVCSIHSPKDYDDAFRARRRISFDALVTYSAAMLTIRGVRQKISCAPINKDELDVFFASLPYSPTGAQRRAIDDIKRDLTSGQAMCRLVQGDVGSGKTLVAAAAAYLICRDGRQAALMAPTEILAEQHHRTMTGLLSPFGIRVGLLTGGMTAAEKRKALAALKDGETDLIIGTHALFQNGVCFKNPGLVITDEQHRFGVAQRAALSSKGEGVHTLVMSATPIPRTLSLILYGDLDLSVIDEMPAGRQPISTFVIDSAKRSRALGFIRKHVEDGRQAYIVCPLVEDGEDENGLRSATGYAEDLANGEFSDISVGLLHGRMKPKEKDCVMRKFLSGEIKVLVSTTVIEVGVDAPNATVMLIENAERFGLSQLHQLRGRVGRGGDESFCILVSDTKNEATRERLSVIKQTSDGFKIAEEDLRLRGPGDLLGMRQHGLPNVDLVSDPALFSLAQEAALKVLKGDPELCDPRHEQLCKEVSALIGGIGDLPN